jgi:uncharacterized RDD family membrane protein YckC/type II secretory pathway pseudopilin PulG
MFCRHCGTKQAEDASFCANCGKPTGIIPAAEAPVPTPVVEPASIGRRFANYILDIIIAYAIFIAIAVLANFANSTVAAILFIFSFVMFFFYHIIFEAIWQRTPGKWITGTKVVAYDGGKPKFLNIVGRTFARIIPFEAFSFFFNPIGWHDSLSKTLVVPKKYTTQQIQHIVKPETKGVAKVIIAIIAGIVGLAIIGLVASVILLSINVARGKARDAERVAVARQIATRIEMYYATNSTYPPSLQSLVPQFLEKVPVAPTPADGECTEEQNRYTYTLIHPKDAYSLTTCLGLDSPTYKKGVYDFGFNPADFPGDAEVE